MPGLILNPAEIRQQFTPLAAPSVATAARIPNRIDRRDEMLPASDQRATSECAAYAVAGILEARNWRDTGSFQQIDPAPIYAEAKRHDGSTRPGTTLDAALRAAVRLQLLPEPGVIHAFLTREDYYRALHRYGLVLLAFNITEAWRKPSTSGWLRDDADQPLIGGHAVVGCGYDRNPKGWNAVQNSWNDSNGWHGFIRMTHAQFDRQFMYGMAWS